MHGRLWRGTSTDAMPPTRLEAGENCVRTSVKQGCRDELSSRRMSCGHEDDARCKALPRSAVPASVIDRRFRYAQRDERLGGDHSVRRGSAQVVAGEDAEAACHELHRPGVTALTGLDGEAVCSGELRVIKHVVVAIAARWPCSNRIGVGPP